MKKFFRKHWASGEKWRPKEAVLPQRPVGKCPECGRDMFRTEMYSCPRTECPVQTKAIL